MSHSKYLHQFNAEGETRRSVNSFIGEQIKEAELSALNKAKKISQDLEQAKRLEHLDERLKEALSVHQ